MRPPSCSARARMLKNTGSLFYGQRFYEKMLKQGARPASALRAAQVEMCKRRQWQSPYY